MRRWLVAFAVAAAAFGVPAAQAYTLKTLYSFCVRTGCPDGKDASGGLVQDPAGNLYGTATFGGSETYGVVFALVKSGNGWTYRVAHDFCSESECADGAFPGTKLISDENGNIFGTVGQEGPNQGGVAFELTPNAKHTKWTYHALYDFCSLAGCADGALPDTLTYAGAASGAFYDGVSPLYGEAASGGIDNGGVVFRLFKHGHAWKQDVLYRFCKNEHRHHECIDGDGPSGGLWRDDASGVLYGTTETGGKYQGFGDGGHFTHGAGTVFMLEPRGGGKLWKQTTLHLFCAARNCTDGALPHFGLTMNGSGMLMGVTEAGGTTTDMGTHGTLYGIVPNGANSQETVLYDFCSQPGCSDTFPSSGLALSGGDVFGEAANMVYRLSGTTFDVLYGFCAQQGCPDGDVPSGGLLPDASGNLFGVTGGGGASNQGTVFELSP
jgi:uncharacterized repeat protein (TIGR03803 family)